MLLLIALIRFIYPTNCRSDGILYFPHRTQSLAVFHIFPLWSVLQQASNIWWTITDNTLTSDSRNSSTVSGRVAWNNAEFVPAQALSSGLSLSTSKPSHSLWGYVGFLSKSSSQVRLTQRGRAYSKPQTTGILVSLPSSRHLWSLPASSCIKP